MPCRFLDHWYVGSCSIERTSRSAKWISISQVSASRGRTESQTPARPGAYNSGSAKRPHELEPEGRDARGYSSLPDSGAAASPGDTTEDERNRLQRVCG